MKKLAENIYLYLSYLNDKCNLTVSCHFESTFVYLLPPEVFSILVKYNSHANPYCMSVKKNNHHKCIINQKNILKSKAKTGFEITCHAGVLEYIYPVFKDSSMIGFVCVSGYRTGDKCDCNYDFELWEHSLKKDKLPVEICNALIPPLVIMLEKLFLSYDNCSSGEYNTIIQFLNEYHTNVTLSELCNYFGRSESYISHMFKKQSGLTFKGYCNNLKLKDAKKLLLSTDKQVTEIAYDSGFNDVSYFISLFKKKYGVSPYKYRKINK